MGESKSPPTSLVWSQPTSSNNRRRIRHLLGLRKATYLILGVLLTISFLHFRKPTALEVATAGSSGPLLSSSRISSNKEGRQLLQPSEDYPFSGAFSRFPTVSVLSPEQRRVTVVAIWNNDYVTEYLRHFLYGAQLNADALDLLIINRRMEWGKCMDFTAAGIDITWGGNIKVVCMSEKDYVKHHVDFLCSKDPGWDCNEDQHADVTLEFSQYFDDHELQWRPIRAHVFRDLFAHPENPFGGWMDPDTFMGNFARLPLNVLSQLSFITGESYRTDAVFLRGQLTLMNLDEPGLRHAWKKFPHLKSAEHFAQRLEGRMGNIDEESYWSLGYIRSDPGLPGEDLEWCQYPDLHGDDVYEDVWEKEGAQHMHVVSGRELILVPVNTSRSNLEKMILTERAEPIDDLGGVGWTSGEDGSAAFLDASLNRNDAVRLAQDNIGSLVKDVSSFSGIVEEIVLQKQCPDRAVFRHTCIKPHPEMEQRPYKYDVSLLRLREQKPNHVLRRLERRDPKLKYERKLLRHHLWSKKRAWFQFPPFEITPEMVMKYNTDFIEVFKMGPARKKTLFYRSRTSKKKIG